MSLLWGIVFLLCPLAICAQEIDGVKYDLNESTYKATVIHHEYEGDIVLPEKVTYREKTYTVAYIARGAFDDCPELVSVSIPKTVITFEDFASYSYGNKFYGSTKLEALHVAADNPKYSSADGVLYDKDKTVLYCFPQAKGGEYTLPSSVTTINRFAFSSCRSLKSVFLHKRVSEIGDYAFFDCQKALLWIETGITCPIESTTLNGLDENSCTIVAPSERMADIQAVWEGNLYDIETTPCVVTGLQEYIKGCTFSIANNPTKLRTEHPVAIAGGILAEAYGDGLYLIKGLSPNTSYELSLQITISAAGQTQMEEVFALPFKTLPATVTITTAAQQAAITVTGISASEDLTACPMDYGVTCGEQDYPILPPAPMQIQNLRIDYPYYLRPYVVYDDGEKVYGTYHETATLATVPKCYATERSIDGMHVSVTCRVDTTVHIEKFGITFKGNSSTFDADGESHTIGYSGLKNNTPYTFQPFIIYNGGKIHYGSQNEIYTLSISPRIVLEESTPTTLVFKTSYNAHANVYSDSLICNGKAYHSNQIITGLEPGTAYKVTYHAKVMNGVEETASINASTTPLELNLLQPKGVSATSTLVAATTNLSEEEDNVGFQWRKYDAPGSLKPKEGIAAIRDGRIEGRIENLQPTSYYNVRAFYLSDAGNYYYTDWTTFDPSDFSYFEPTVHTYFVDEISTNRAVVRGYALAGTDEITEQGFQYWPTGEEGDTAPDESEIVSLPATGQVMTASLDGLTPSTDYCIRAFAQTQNGTTYGETLTFTTEDDPLAGIGQTRTEDAKPATITGYYDLGGRKLSAPAKGLNLIRYSDGTVRKVIIP